ncbi:MAG: hypothetical protein M3Y18_05255 [Candidatus Eremiobacteraeota bacterium]|nr:hypothetical protein [Candidatus Eremiobacteraeota bacterium]
MKRLGRFAILACALSLLSNAALSAQGTGGDALLARMAAVNPHLRSYTASIHADVRMLSFPYLSPSLDGTYYHKEPDKNKLVFTSGVPAIAHQFSKVYPQVESASRWKSVYEISVQGDDGTYTTFKLIPRRAGRVDHIDAKVDDRTATVAQLRWNYTDNGGYATLDQHFANFRGNRIVDRQSGHVEVPSYTVDVNSTFANFRLNPNIPNSVFTQQ